jgi:Spy/CpxP family protein refolding chaperone
MSNCSKRSWVIGVVLFASLALNLFLGGWLFGGGTPSATSSPTSRGMFFESFNQKVATLPEPERSKVQQVLDFYQPELKKQMNYVMRSREAADKLFKSKNYQREDAEEVFNEMQFESMQMQQMAQEMMLDLADVLPPEHRAKFMERPKEWRGGGKEFKSMPKKPVAAKAPKPAAENPAQ